MITAGQRRVLSVRLKFILYSTPVPQRQTKDRFEDTSDQMKSLTAAFINEAGWIKGKLVDTPMMFVSEPIKLLCCLIQEHCNVINQMEGVRHPGYGDRTTVNRH